MKVLVRKQLKEVTWTSWNTYMRMIVLGMNGPVGMQLEEVTWSVLKYAHEKGCPWTEETCIDAARGVTWTC